LRSSLAAAAVPTTPGNKRFGALVAYLGFWGSHVRLEIPVEFPAGPCFFMIIVGICFFFCAKRSTIFQCFYMFIMFAFVD